MVNRQPGRRGYDSSRRRARAAESRRRIVLAAHDLFVERGFPRTSVAAIAEAADVSVPTVYQAFPSKADILKRAIDVALAGDEGSTAVSGRPPARWVDEADNAEDLLSRYAAMMGALAERAVPIYLVLARAADSEPDLGDLLADFEAQRLRAATRIAKAVRARGGLPVGRSVASVRDTIWVLNSPELYGMLVHQRGWSTKRYVAWARDALLQLVASPPSPGRVPTLPLESR
jgi:AcrR family transcriptional regulator